MDFLLISMVWNRVKAAQPPEMRNDTLPGIRDGVLLRFLHIDMRIHSFFPCRAYVTMLSLFLSGTSCNSLQWQNWQARWRR
jgi:hypothetical protein